MKKQIELLKQFHTAFGHPVESKPTFLSDDRLGLRIALIQEELNEVEEAMMVNYHPDIIKEISDLLVVVFGTVIECGYQDLIEQAFEEVMRSNMSKLGVDGKPIYREDGKILKGPNYSEAKIII
jgi:predicted HAD superfamily Cof-like phosphohydrolase